MTDFVDEGQFGSIHRRGHIAIALAHELSSYGNVLKPSQIQCRQDDCSRTLNLPMDSAPRNDAKCLGRGEVLILHINRQGAGGQAEKPY